jgi:hypothetical protein
MSKIDPNATTIAISCCCSNYFSPLNCTLQCTVHSKLFNRTTYPHTEMSCQCTASFPRAFGPSEPISSEVQVPARTAHPSANPASCPQSQLIPAGGWTVVCWTVVCPYAWRCGVKNGVPTHTHNKRVPSGQKMRNARTGSTFLHLSRGKRVSNGNFAGLSKHLKS